jgi:hypothetical protein
MVSWIVWRWLEHCLARVVIWIPIASAAGSLTEEALSVVDLPQIGAQLRSHAFRAQKLEMSVSSALQETTREQGESSPQQPQRKSESTTGDGMVSLCLFQRFLASRVRLRMLTSCNLIVDYLPKNWLVHINGV